MTRQAEIVLHYEYHCEWCGQPLKKDETTLGESVEFALVEPSPCEECRSPTGMNLPPISPPKVRYSLQYVDVNRKRKEDAQEWSVSGSCNDPRDRPTIGEVFEGDTEYVVFENEQSDRLLLVPQSEVQP